MSLIKHHTLYWFTLITVTLIADSYYNYDLISNVNDAVPSYIIRYARSLQAFVTHLLHRRYLDFTALSDNMICE
jgi:hypothetical protein